MSLSINRKIFDRVKTAIAETGRIDMLSWAKGHDSVTAESVDEIRKLSLLSDCRTTACIGGLTYHLATAEEIARAAEIYGLEFGNLIWVLPSFWCKQDFCYSFLMNPASLFADPKLLHLERVSSGRDRITLVVKTKSRQALCPRCHSRSSHLHSRYVRWLADLLWLGIAVRPEVRAGAATSLAPKARENPNQSAKINRRLCVSIRASLRQRGELILRPDENFNRRVSIRASLRQRGEPSKRQLAQHICQSFNPRLTSAARRTS